MRKKPTDNRVAKSGDQPSDEVLKGIRLDHIINRRTFVKKGSGILLVAGAAACDSEGNPTGPRGAVHVTLVGLHPNAVNGGSINATRIGGGTAFIIDVPAVAQHSRNDVPVGEYTVVYNTPPNHVLATGQTIPPTITISESNPFEITISLVSRGGVRVNVTGITGFPANGGSALAQRTDAAAAAVALPVSAAGLGQATVDTGTYDVSYTPPAGFNISSTNPVTGVVVGLGSNPPTPAAFTVQAVTGATGSLRVTVNGLTGATAGGSVSARLADNTGNTFTGTLPAPTGGSSATTLASLPVGSYNVTYTPPAGFNVSSTNPITGLAVAQGATADGVFTVQAVTVATGSLRVTVTGLTGATAGGSISARLTNNTGNTFTGTLPAPTSGSSTTTLASLPVGSYNVTYSPPSGFSLVAGQANPKVGVVTDSATVDVPFTAQQSVGAPAILWGSDWSTATGTTPAAVGDGGRWENIFNNGTNLMDVIAASGLGFPAAMTNVLRIHAVDPAPGLMFGNTGNGWGTPAVGEHRYFRWYWRCSLVTPDTDDMNMHFILPAPNTGIWAVQSSPVISGAYNLRFAVDFPPQHQFGANPDLTPDNVFRLETHWHRTGTSTFTFEGRIYNSADVLVNDTTQLVCNGLGGHAAHSGTAGSYTLADANDFNGLRGVRLAHEGGGGGFNGTTNDRVYFGGWAVSAVDWVGPYAPGQVTP